jgi:hypothetical protein
MIGIEINPNGNEYLVNMPKTIQKNEPIKKVTMQVIRYNLVFLERSNLLRYEMSKPG